MDDTAAAAAAAAAVRRAAAEAADEDGGPVPVVAPKVPVDADPPRTLRATPPTRREDADATMLMGADRAPPPPPPPPPRLGPGPTPNTGVAIGVAAVPAAAVAGVAAVRLGLDAEGAMPILLPGVATSGLSRALCLEDEEDEGLDDEGVEDADEGGPPTA